MKAILKTMIGLRKGQKMETCRNGGELAQQRKKSKDSKNIMHTTFLIKVYYSKKQKLSYFGHIKRHNTLEKLFLEGTC